MTKENLKRVVDEKMHICNLYAEGWKSKPDKKPGFFLVF